VFGFLSPLFIAAIMDTEKPRNDSDFEKDPLPGISDEAIRTRSVVPETNLTHSHDADAALEAFQGLEGQVLGIDEETSRRLLWKIDCHLMPVRFLPQPASLFHLRNPWTIVGRMLALITG
jgi:hypothetical protein